MSNAGRDGFKGSVDLAGRFLGNVTDMRGVDSLKAVREDREVTAELIAKQSEPIEDEAPRLHGILYSSGPVRHRAGGVDREGQERAGISRGGLREMLSLRGAREASGAVVPSYFSADGREVAVRVLDEAARVNAAVARQLIQGEMSAKQKKSLIARLESEITDGQMLPAPILAGRGLTRSWLPIIERDGIPDTALVVDRGAGGSRFSLLGGLLMDRDTEPDALGGPLGEERMTRGQPGGVFAMTDGDLQVSLTEIETIPEEEMDSFIDSLAGSIRKAHPDRIIKAVPLDREHLIAHMVKSDPRSSATLVAAASRNWEAHKTKEFLEEMSDPETAYAAYRSVEPDIRREVETRSEIEPPNKSLGFYLDR